MIERTPYGAKRLKAKVLAIIDHRIAVCRAELARYEAEGSSLQSSERAAVFEAELLRRQIAELPAAGDRP